MQDIISVSIDRYSPIQKLKALCENPSVLKVGGGIPQTVKDLEEALLFSYNFMTIKTQGIEKPRIIILPRRDYIWLTSYSLTGKNLRLLHSKLLYSDELKNSFIMYRSKKRLRDYPASGLVYNFREENQS